MNPILHACCTLLGALALAASLSGQKKAGWYALVGTGILLPLAIRDDDPVLALGVLLVLVIHSWSPASDPVRAVEPATRPPAATPDQAP